MESKLLTQKEAAAALGVCTNTLRRWKDCPRVYISPGRFRYSLEDVLAWLNTHSRTQEA